MKRWVEHFRQEWSRSENRAALWASLALVTSFLAPGVAVYLRNSGEFVFHLSSVFAVTAAMSVVMCWAIARLQLCFRGRGFAWSNALTLALAMVIWVQWSLMGRNIGVLRGSMIDWGAYSFFMLWESALIVLILTTVLCFRKAVSRMAMKLSLLCILGQFIPLIWEAATWKDPGYLHREFTLNQERKFEFGNRSNVLVIITDAVGRDGLRQAFARYPDLPETFRDFHCFRDMISPMPRTAFAVPSILTGRLYPEWKQDLNDETIHAEFLKDSYYGEHSLLRHFRNAGYECEGYPFTVQTIWYDPALLNNVEEIKDKKITSLIPWFDLWLFRMVPTAIKQFVINDSQWLFRQFIPAETHDGFSDLREWDLVFLQGVINDFKVGERRDVMKYLHLQSGHLPLEINADCEPLRDGGHVDMTDQIAGSYRIIGKLLEKMRQSGIYDRSMIVITADHSESYGGEISTLIKCPGDTADFIRYNDTPGQVNEIAATIRRIMLPGDAPPGETRSLFDPPLLDRVSSVDWPINRCRLEPFSPVPEDRFAGGQVEADFWTVIRFPREGEVIFQDQSDQISRLIADGNCVSVVLSDPVSGADQYSAPIPQENLLEDTGIEMTMDFSTVRDGVYALRYAVHPDGELRTLPLSAFASYYLEIRGGKLQPGTRIVLPPVPFRPGDDLLLQPGRIFPQLNLRNGKVLGTGEMQLSDKSRLEVPLAPGASGKIQLHFRAPYVNLEGVEFYHRDLLLGRCKVEKKPLDYTVTFDVPQGVEKLQLRFCFLSGPLSLKRHRLILSRINFLPEKPSAILAEVPDGV